MISQHVHMGHRSTAWLNCLGSALVEGNNVSGVGNTEREEVVEDDDFDEDEDTETELVTEERTEEAVADVEELIETDELPVVGVGVVEVLQNIIVSQREDNRATEIKPTSAARPEHGMRYSPRTSSSRMVLVGIANHHADDSTDEDDDSNDEANNDGSPVLAPHGGLLAGVHDGRAAGVADVIRLHDSARGRRRVVAFELRKIGHRLWLSYDRKFR